MKYKASRKRSSDTGVKSIFQMPCAARFLCEGDTLAGSWSKWRRKHAIREKSVRTKDGDKILNFQNGACLQSLKTSKKIGTNSGYKEERNRKGYQRGNEEWIH